MALYAIGDLHLHYQSELKAPGQLHGRVWKTHEEKIRKNCFIIRSAVQAERMLASIPYSLQEM